MKRPLCFEFRRIAIGLAFIAPILMRPATATETKLSDIPLANAATVSILPNIYFVLDDSGSMGWDYMPDYVSNSYCRGIGSNLVACNPGDPPFYASSFNRVYYNPMINYTAPINADGSSKTSYTTWTNVPKDGYGIQSTETINLTTKYPERVACKHTYDDPNGTNCKAQIDGTSYKYPDTTYFNILTKEGAPFYYTASVEWCTHRDNSPRFGAAGTCQTKKDATHTYVRYFGWARVDIIPSVNSYPGPNSTTRTYAEEMTNFANWFAWYRTRMQMTKTGVGQAFSKIRGTPLSDLDDPNDKNFFHARIGFSTINETGTNEGAEFLNIRNFDSGQKANWFAKLYGAVPSGSTPLLGALSKAGRIYAGKIGSDPIQYSCQRNFTMLSTDGYWNSVTAAYGPNKEDGVTRVGDQDGAKTVSPPSFDKLGKANTLADVAYYYYHTDLRPGSCDVCEDNVPVTGTHEKEDDVAKHQHMTTFTIGLGVDGSLVYEDGYKTSRTGDYFALINNPDGVWWPDPTDTEDLDRIDDLWHAAVNGRGTYLSAKNPESLINGLNTALGSIEKDHGSGASAATSSLEPVEGNNTFFVASYNTVTWDGELSAKTINPETGEVSLAATWTAAGLLDGKIASDGLSDTRTIYTSNATSLISFNYSNLSTTQKAYFNNNQLSQYSGWSASQIADGTPENLLKYIRGQNRYENQDRPDGYGAYSRLYRDRPTTLGDIVHAQPVYVQAPPYSFADSGYDAFKTSLANRAPTVYVSANDGMLHAFDAVTGKERWAYVPPIVMPNLWRLAEENYTNNHRYFIDGPLTVADIDDGGTWKSILIGALGKGGRGYFALDITDPASPKYMWSFTADTNPNMGYSYGAATVTKVDGTWVVLLPSGYNNIPESGKYTSADGIGRLFVLNAASGNLIKQISTDVGSVSTPSGFAKINPRIQFFETDNTATLAYGGDLLGNLWRFDLLNGTVSKIITLGSNQPITVAPEIADASGKTVLYFGTGRYLSQDDLTLDKQQAIYGIKDNGTSELTLSSLVEQTITSDKLSTNTIDWNVNGGWFINLIKEKERVALEAKLVLGTLIVASIVPLNTECAPGGESRLYFIDYFSGGNVDNGQSVYTYDSPIVGMSVIRTKDGIKIIPVTANGGIGSPRKVPTKPPGGGGAESGRRLMWRELVE